MKLSIDKINAKVADSGTTKEQLCLNAGVSHVYLIQTIKRIEDGVTPQMGKMKKLGRVLGCDWRELVEDSEG